MRVESQLLFLLPVLAAGCPEDAAPSPPARVRHEDGRPPVSSAVLSADVDRVQGRNPRASAPTLNVVEARRPPKLDGSLSDAVWRSANRTARFVDPLSGDPASVEAFAFLTWDKRYLYLAVEVRDRLLRARHWEPDAPLWEQDCVELMLDPDGDGRNYFELLVSPRGVVFDSFHESPRIPKPFGHTEWNGRARVAVSTRGAIGDLETDAGYTVEAAIPWQAFSWDNARARPPEIGERWRANLYAVDLQVDGVRAAAWSPPRIADFHVPARFGMLVFEGPPGRDLTVGHDEPVSMPSSRVKQSQSREEARNPGAPRLLIKRRLTNRRHPGEPLPVRAEGRERLETEEGAH